MGSAIKMESMGGKVGGKKRSGYNIIVEIKIIIGKCLYKHWMEKGHTPPLKRMVFDMKTKIKPRLIESF